jgi:hypothetical protein
VLRAAAPRETCTKQLVIAFLLMLLTVITSSSYLLACICLQEELGAEGGSEEYARRFCGVVASFGDAHWTQMSGVAQQHLLLRHVSAALCAASSAALDLPVHGSAKGQLTSSSTCC